MEKVYIRGNVTCNAMTNRETLYNTCELDTRCGHMGIMTVYDYSGRWKENADDQM